MSVLVDVGVGSGWGFVSGLMCWSCRVGLWG